VGIRTPAVPPSREEEKEEGREGREGGDVPAICPKM